MHVFKELNYLNYWKMENSYVYKIFEGFKRAVKVNAK